MFELRWLVWEEKAPWPFDFARDLIGGGPRIQTTTQRKLQYRQKIDTTRYIDDGSIIEKVWSEWKDVPEVSKDENICK